MLLWLKGGLTRKPFTFYFIMAVFFFLIGTHSSSLHSSEEVEGLSQCQRCGNRWVCRADPAPWAGWGRKIPGKMVLAFSLPAHPMDQAHCSHLAEDKSDLDYHYSHAFLSPWTFWCCNIYGDLVSFCIPDSQQQRRNFGELLVNGNEKSILAARRATNCAEPPPSEL